MLDLEGFPPFVPSRPHPLSRRIEGPSAFIDSLFVGRGLSTNDSLVVAKRSRGIRKVQELFWHRDVSSP